MSAIVEAVRRRMDPASLFEVTGKTPDAWQARAVRSQAPRLLLNCCRQSGKGEVMSVLAAHLAMSRPGSLCLMVSPGLRQSTELAFRTRALIRSLGLAASKDNALELVMENTSRCVSLPGQESTVRGFSAVDLLCLDEAARVPDELYAAVRPMLAVAERARIVAASTPFGRRGWWWEAWDQGGDAWERYEVPASEVARISPAFLDEERRALGAWYYRQEYECSFIDSAGQLFRQVDIDRAFNAGAGLPGLFGEFPQLQGDMP